jgi:DNA-binding transcriptional LysR family regulator
VGIFAENTPTHGLEVAPFQEDRLVVLCSRRHPLARRKRAGFGECLEHEFVGLNRGSSLLELTARAAEQYGQPLRLRIQLRSFDAMCQMIDANLGIGVLPLGVLRSPLPRSLKVVELTEAWARRRLFLGISSERAPSSAAELLRKHLAAYAQTSADAPESSQVL